MFLGAILVLLLVSHPAAAQVIFTTTVSNANDSGVGSLRAALTNVNAVGKDEYRIHFSIPMTPQTQVPTINLISGLPPLAQPTAAKVIIDGTTQPGSGRVQLNGAGAGSPAVDGLQITAGNTTLKGLAINRFSGDGIDLRTNGGNIVVGCFIGTNAAATAIIGFVGTRPFSYRNTGVGVRINAIPNNRIGGTAAGERNVISGNAQDGIFISSGNSTGNQVLGNYIGTDIGGTLDFGNAGDGIIMGGPNNFIGGNVAGAGNVISGNGERGLYLLGGASGNRVLGNFIGTTATGTAALPNALDGVLVYNFASNNVIGGSTPQERNLVSGNLGAGIRIDGSAGAPNGTMVQGNYIGTNAAGSSRIPNATGAVVFSATNTTLNGNVISGNGGDGVVLQNSSGPKLYGNLIGTNSDGIAALGNGNNGVFVVASTTVAIGDNAMSRNVISANGANGLFIAGNNGSGVVVCNNLIGTNGTGLITDPDGSPATGDELGNRASGLRLESSSNNTIGGTLAGQGNVISGNFGSGVELAIFNGSASNNNTIQGNRIGTDANGTLDRGNGLLGILVDGGANNLIGGATLPARNIISGNDQHGVFIQKATASGNTIQGNYIGTNADGNSAIGNRLGGIYVTEGSNNLIGGTSSGAGNLISGNGNGTATGINLNASSGNTVQGNFIGTNAAGTSVVPNRRGLDLALANNNLVGGTTPEARNVIAGNTDTGVLLHDNSAHNTIAGNYIGTDVTGTIDFGNGLDGVQLENAPDNLVGGATAGAGNIISGNSRDGVHLLDADAKRNVVQGNRIGTRLDGINPLGNDGNGVYDKNAPNNVIGLKLDGTGAGNIIAFNAGNGVTIFEAMPNGAFGNTIRGNAIFSNMKLGIDLDNDGVTPNDADDPDPGANYRQNFPVIGAVPELGGTTVISGNLNSTPNKTFLLDFYRSASPDPSAFGEGQRYLGRAQVTTLSSGDTSFSFSFPSGTVNTGQYITATATNAATGDTSEFSAAHLIELAIGGRIQSANGDALPNVNIMLTGDSSPASTSTNSTGFYNFKSVLSGRYRITPSKSGVYFDPPYRDVLLTTTSITGQNFIGGPGFRIIGRVAAVNGVALENVPVTRTGGPAASSITVLTNGAGYYTFNGVLAGSYDVAPQLAGYVFTPSSRAVEIIGSDVTGQNFVGSQGYRVTGRISTSSGVALANVNVSRTGSSTAVLTNTAGYYTFYDVPAGTYTITPAANGMTFTPATRSVTVTNADINGQNFTGM